MIPAIEEVVEHLSRLPGIGVKLATRLAYHLLKRDPAEAQVLARGIACLHERVYRCVCCGAFCEGRTCALCTDASRDRCIICVVERAQDVEMMAGVGEYRGLFHVLGGVIAPLEGVGPDQLRIAALLKRLQESSVREVILALNPTVEGDTTALYVQKILANFPVIVTRLASGIPVGGDLEYIDRTTLAHSLRGRRPLDCSEA